jgi:hypothetical protein
MCTVIVEVPDDGAGAVRLLAVRDEDPSRPWDAVGPWWPDTHPGIVGVRDARAGGAWLAADPASGRLGVILNREDLSGRGDDEVTTRGAVALEAAAGRAPAATPTTRGFNLVTVDGATVTVVSWDGIERREQRLGPGTHMIAHDDADDPRTARIAAWLPAFRAASVHVRAERVGNTRTLGAHTHSHGPGFAGWLDVLDRSAELPATDDRAIIRDNRPMGYPTLSLLACTAVVGPGYADVRYGEFTRPALWDRAVLE